MGEFDNLGDEVLLEILKRVPIKFAHRCKSVSKRCLDLISSDYFSLCYNRYYSCLANSVPRFALVYHFVESKKRAYHRINSKKWEYYKFRMVHFCDPTFLHIDFGPSPPSPSRPLVTDDIHVLCCSNGLVLCSHTDTSASPAQYYVCNAVNKKWVTIPQSPSGGAAQTRVGFLCRAPILSSYNFNENTSISEDFDISCSFRIVRMLLDKDNWDVVKVEVYASETGEWAEIVLDECVISKIVRRAPRLLAYNSNNREELWHRDNAVPCNGSLYWRISGVLLVIDPYNSQHGTVNLSDEILECRWYHKKIYIGESNRRLRCITFQSGNFTIYELENNDRHAGNWLSVQDIHFREIKHHKYSWIGKFFQECSSMSSRQGFSSIVFHPFDENVLFICFNGNITLFNMETKTLTTIWDLGNDYERDSHVPRAFPIVLPWWPLLETRIAEKSEKANNFETLNLAFEKLKLESIA